MLRLRQVGASASNTDLGVILKNGQGLPFYVIDPTLEADIIMDEETNKNQTFNKEIYDTDVDSRFTNLANFRLEMYGYSCRLIYDNVTQKTFITYNPDYVPLLNTANRTTTFNIHNLGGIIGSTNRTTSRMDLKFDPRASITDDIKFEAPASDITTDDFKIYKVYLRGIRNVFETRVRKTSSTDSNIVNYYYTNELYFMKMDKQRFFGNSPVYVHEILPYTLNKFSINPLTKITDIDYVWVPIVLG